MKTIFWAVIFFSQCSLSLSVQFLNKRKFDNCDLSLYDCVWSDFKNLGGNQNLGISTCSKGGVSLYVAKRAKNLEEKPDDDLKGNELANKIQELKKTNNKKVQIISHALQLAKSKVVKNFIPIGQICIRSKFEITTIMPFIKVFKPGSPLTTKCISEVLKGALELYRMGFTYTDYKTENIGQYVSGDLSGQCLLTDAESLCEITEELDCPNVNMLTGRYVHIADNSLPQIKRITLYVILDEFVNDICLLHDITRLNSFEFGNFVENCIIKLNQISQYRVAFEDRVKFKPSEHKDVKEMQDVTKYKLHLFGKNG